MADSRRFENLIVGDIPDDCRDVELGEALRIAIDDDDRHPERGQILHSGPSDPAETTDDRVPGHPADVSVHSPTLHVLT